MADEGRLWLEQLAGDAIRFVARNATDLSDPGDEPTRPVREGAAGDTR